MAELSGKGSFPPGVFACDVFGKKGATENAFSELKKGGKTAEARRS